MNNKKYDNPEILKKIDDIQVRLGYKSINSIHNRTSVIRRGGLKNPSDRMIYDIVESLFVKQCHNTAAIMFAPLVLEAVCNVFDIKTDREWK